MIDHLGFPVSDIVRAKTFYDAAFAPLGVKEIARVEKGGPPILGYGRTKPDFWISTGTPAASLHVAIVAGSRAEVDAFWAAAVAAGGRDNGKPGIRAIYHPDYYAAFVYDPDGHNIEAVCRKPE